jgi:hypothetical protein
MKIEQKNNGSVFAKILTPTRVIGITIVDQFFNEANVAELYDCVNVYDVEFDEYEALSFTFKNEHYVFMRIDE